ncbi:MAG: FixH family protein [Anaerolineales bacterium]|nr:FixH family protein [Anaerolineales bacterium]
MKTIIPVLFVLTCFLLVGCNDNGADVKEADQAVAIEVLAPVFPPVVGSSDLVLRVTDVVTGMPIDDAYLSVKGDMEHDGMMPVLTSAKAGLDGEYVIPFEWTMGGDWIVTVDATLADGMQVTQDFNLVVDGDEVTCLPVAKE